MSSVPFPAAEKSKSPLPKSFSLPMESKIVRESMRDGDLKRDARRKIGFDQTGDDIHRRPLRGENQMNPGRSGFLRQPGNVFLDIPPDRHHQIRQLVDNNYDPREFFMNQRFVVG